MANKQRGEVTINLDDTNYTLRPSFEALCEIEDRLDTSIPALISQFQQGNVRIKSLAIVVWAGVWAIQKDKAPTIPQFGEMINRKGLLNVMKDDKGGPSPIATFLSKGILGEKQAEEVIKQQGNPEESSQKDKNLESIPQEA